MMEKESHETTSSNGEEERETWGTLEELLLACAVNRHGTTSWDSIATDLQKRIKHSFLSPHNCHRKYVDLTRRFSAAGEEERKNSDEDLLRVVVDELRKLRVQELKRELHRHDVSIVSLQLKVKRLEEERENSSAMAEEARICSDLRIKPNENAMLTGEITDSPEKFDSAEDRSFNESNSSSDENKKSSGAVPEKEERESKSKPDEKVSADPVWKAETGSENVSTSRPGELGESVSELKRESGKSSEVQSSASLSKRRRRFRGLLPGWGSSGDDELDSPANKRISVKSQPLFRFLDIIRLHKHGSVFLRRLPSQETEKYRNVIRQHMDLDTVQSKLDKGIYANSHPKFYRDLLLIFTNSILFYRKTSAEHLAARELRKLVTHEIARIPNLTRPDPEPVVKKPRSSTTSMVVCRRRSSAEPTMQANNLSSEQQPVKKSDHTVLENNSGPKDDDTKLEMTATNRREKVVGSSHNRKQDHNRPISVLKKQGVANFLKRIKQTSPSSQDKATNDNDDEAEEREKREKVAGSISASKNKRAGNRNNNVKRNRNNNKVVDDGHVVVSRRNLTRRAEREAAVEAQRADGRPPKRKAATISRTTPESSGKGGRSSGKRDGDEKSRKRPRR